MDLAAAARDGIQFFTHKSTEATWVVHSRYGEAMRRARDAGIPVLGAYHVVRSPLNPEAEVDFCLSYVDKHTPWWREHPCWFFQVDLETWPYDAVPASEGENFADLIEARTGRPAVIYASRGQYGDKLTGTSHLLWNANYGTNSSGHFKAVYATRRGVGWTTYSGRMPTFWQFGDALRIGSQNMCDGNAFRGTLAELTALLKGADMFEDKDRATATADTWRTLTLLQNGAAAVYQLPGEPAARREVNGLKAQLDRIEASAAADATRDAAMFAAITALTELVNAGGGSVDAAVILERITTAAAGVRELVEVRHAEQMAVLAGDRDAQIAALRAQLDALGATPTS
mgnify:CR=1 FL=1